jgi:hypothetical protein
MFSRCAEWMVSDLGGWRSDLSWVRGSLDLGSSGIPRLKVQGDNRGQVTSVSQGKGGRNQGSSKALTNLLNKCTLSTCVCIIPGPHDLEGEGQPLQS